MKNRRTIALLIVGIAILVLTFLFLRGDRMDWSMNFKKDNKDPYGCYVIYNLLEDYLAEEKIKVITDSISGQLPDENVNGSYIFIGNGMYLTESDIESLLDFVGTGNEAFIASRTIPSDLMLELFYNECDGVPWNGYYAKLDSTIQLNFVHQNFRDKQGYKFRYRKSSPYKLIPWKYISNEYFCEDFYNPLALGHMNDTLVNFARFAYGDGHFYLHTTPSAFSNYFLVEQNSKAYVEKALSHLSPGPVYWDSYSKISENMAQRMNRNTPWLSEKSPLQYILEQAPLTWAWYLLLSLGLLYMVFRAKRKQRIIPISDPNTNTSLEFLSSMSRLYFLHNNHKKIALLKMKFFENHVRDQYHLSGAFEGSTLDKLASRSGISKNHIEKIILMYNNIKRSGYVSDNTLIDFHQLVDYFYKNCK